MIKITDPGGEYLLALLTIMRKHDCPLIDKGEVLHWLDQCLTDYEVLRDELLAQYGASRPETRSEGEFSGCLRERQAKSAQAAMMGMGAKLQEAYDEIERLKRRDEELVKTCAPLLAAFPDAAALGIYLRVHAEEIREWCGRARRNPELAEEMVTNEKGGE